MLFVRHAIRNLNVFDVLAEKKQNISNSSGT